MQYRNTKYNLLFFIDFFRKNCAPLMRMPTGAVHLPRGSLERSSALSSYAIFPWLMDGKHQRIPFRGAGFGIFLQGAPERAVSEKAVFGNRRIVTLFIFCIAGICSTLPASAQLDVDSDLPIDIIGDKLEALEEEGYAIWTGNVQVTQGQAFLTTEKLVVYADIDEGQVQKLIASGGMRYTNGSEAISGDNGVYDEADGTLRVTGNVVAVQGKQVMSGESLLYYVESGQLEVKAGAKKRVRGIFYTETPDEEDS